MSRSIPGPGDFCHGCNRLLCRCQPEPDVDARYVDSYEAGYEACLADGYCERPMTEWVYLTGSRPRWDADEKRVVHLMGPLRFAELTWRHHHASAWRYRQWFERQYGRDLEAYLVGYDDAGCGLPSGMADPETHARRGRGVGPPDLPRGRAARGQRTGFQWAPSAPDERGKESDG